MSRRVLTPFFTGAVFGAALALPVALAAQPARAQIAAAIPQPTTAQAEAKLRQTVTDIQNGRPDYESMTPALAEAVRATQPSITPQLASLGLPTTFTRVGAGENPWIWDVAFEKGMTLTWTISLAPGGQTLTGLFVKPKDGSAQP